MSEFIPALKLVLRNEGGLSEDPKDPGGITNFGISLRFLKTIPDERLKKYGIFDVEVNEQTIRDLTVTIASNIYEGEFWIPNRVAEIQNQKLANYVFDCIINPNPTQGIKFLQRAIWAADGFLSCKDDGILGSKTLDLANKCDPDFLQHAVRCERAHWYKAQKNPHFIAGWLRRTYE